MPIHFRPIRPDDKAELVHALGRLSMETVHKRFLAAKPGFSTAELRYLTEVDGHDHLAHVAVDDDGDIVAVARCVRDRAHPESAEFAIVVGDALHHHGIGSALTRDLASAALAVGITRFTATMLPDNEAPRRLMAHVGSQVTDDHFEGGLREVAVDLAT